MLFFGHTEVTAVQAHSTKHCSKSHIQHSYDGQPFRHGCTSSLSCNITLFYTLG